MRRPQLLRRHSAKGGARSHRVAREMHRTHLAGVELLEPRLVLAQTTGLFLNDPAAADGYVLFSPNTATTTYLMNREGQIVNQWHSAYQPGLLAYLQPDGSLLRDSSPHGQGGNGSINAAGAGGLLERFDWNGTKNWEFAYDSPTHLAHHDFEVMPNGHILLIAWELKSEAQATQAGRDPNLPGPGYLYPDSIVEVAPDYANGGGQVVWEWHVWDHLVQQFDATKSNYLGPTGVSQHPELINVNYVSTFDDGAGDAQDWTHANGIDFNADRNEIVLSVREFSEFWIIDHSTTTAQAASHSGGNSGHGGDLLYRFGNPQTYGRGDASDRVFYYQHDPQWIPNGLPGAGDITVFNNGIGRPGQDFSRVEQITTPYDGNWNYTLAAGQAYGPELATWEYTPPVSDFSAIISGAQRLPNGNTLIDYGVKGTFSEVTPSGQEVWRYVSPYAGNAVLGPEDPVPNLGLGGPVLGSLYVNFTFQAIHYPPNYVPQLTSNVVGRKVFYNQSKFDGNTAGVSTSDDLAIATDKVALLPGAGQATFANITSYTRGLNGLMVDIAGPHGTLTASDFIFKVGANNSPSLWSAALETPSITVRPGAGSGGSDRVEILFTAANAPKNQWLEVIVKGYDTRGGFNTNTGLAASDIFFFGNRIGDDGTGTSAQAITSFVDENAARTHSGTALITNVWDYDRTGLVSATDWLASRFNAGTLLKISIANPPAAPEAAPAVATSDKSVENAIITALAADNLLKVDTLSAWVNAQLQKVELAGHDLNASLIDKFIANLVHDGVPRPRAIQNVADKLADQFAVTPDWDDSLLDELLTER